MNSQEWENRFGGVRRSYGQQNAEVLRASHFVVIGLGGVGSWAAEALVRSGIGRITLVDFDDICLSNTNRQLQAVTSQVGQMKSSALKKRFLDIAPSLEVVEIQDMFHDDNADEILGSAGEAVVIDCIDSLGGKAALIWRCRERQIPLVTVGGSAGKTNPTSVKIDDLSQTYGDRLLHKVRKRLRQKHGFPRSLKQKWSIPAIYSDEAPVFPQQDGTVTREVEARPSRPMDCNEGMGSLSFVTGTFGFFAASAAIQLALKS